MRREKIRYNMCQNLWYMIRLAWTTGEKKVIILSLLSALFAVAYVRIYRQDKMCDRYNRNKEGVFGSAGLFAHLAWGPIGLYAAAGSAMSVLFTGVVYVFVCLKALAGAFGLGAVTQYVTSITKVSGGMSNLVAAFGDMQNNAAFLEL